MKPFNYRRFDLRAGVLDAATLARLPAELAAEILARQDQAIDPELAERILEALDAHDAATSGRRKTPSGNAK